MLVEHELFLAAPQTSLSTESFHRLVLVARSGEKKWLPGTSWLEPRIALDFRLEARYEEDFGACQWISPCPPVQFTVASRERLAPIQHLSASSGCHCPKSFGPGARSFSPHGCWPQRGLKYKASRVPTQSNASERSCGDFASLGQACVYPSRRFAAHRATHNPGGQKFQKFLVGGYGRCG